jgi:hypothetical protein
VPAKSKEIERKKKSTEYDLHWSLITINSNRGEYYQNQTVTPMEFAMLMNDNNAETLCNDY